MNSKNCDDFKGMEMSKKEIKNTDTHSEKDGLGKISRRQFTIASVSAIGSSPLVMADQAAEAPPFKLEMSESVRQLMINRHILEEDLIKVIEYAERTGDKLYQQDSDLFLGKLKMHTVYYYAEYSPIEGGHRIHNTYSHRFNLEGTM